ncbi:MAG: FprA family A-type flavoprotein [Thermodesulfobacteriota bacterium]
MDQAIAVADDVFWVGVNDRQTDLFENLWPLVQGISYNAYLIRAAKNVLIDSVKALTQEEHFRRLAELLGQDGTLDYLVINHIEPDHSGAIPWLRRQYPAMQIVGNAKTLDFLQAFYGITDNIVKVGENEVLDAGGLRLRFVLTPMVHWPETMMTYLEERKILFSGDAFGSFGALNGALFADQLEDREAYLSETLRYFANVIGRYSDMLQQALPRIRALDIDCIAPTHGPVWRREVEQLISLHDRWSRHEAEPGVVIAYASMYGHTLQLMEAVAESLSRSGVGRIVVHDVVRSHPSYILRDIWRYRGLILGTPTYNMRPFPLVEDLVNLLDNKRMKNRLLGVFGSYGWSGGGVKQLTDFAAGSKGRWQLVEPVVEAHCAADAEDLAGAAELGVNMARLLGAAGIK